MRDQYTALFYAYLTLSALFRAAVQLGLKENKPKLYRSELKTLNEMRDILVNVISKK